MLLEQKKTPLPLNSSLTAVPGIGEATAKKIARAGITTLEELLYFSPRTFNDLRNVSPISSLHPDENGTVKARVVQVQNKRTRFRRFSITEALLTDGTGYLVAVWFNQPYLAKKLKENKSKTYLFYGAIKLFGNRPTLMNPFFEEWQKKQGHLIPVYPEIAGISTKFWYKKIKQILPSIKYLTDFLPESITTKNKLINLKEAILNIHAPASLAKLKEAKKRLSFDELFLLQLAVQKMKRNRERLHAPRINPKPELVKKFLQNLPFVLTKEQKKAVTEILLDLSKPHPMNRLLEGDVGTGKTVVASLAALHVAQQGFQTVFLAPTEILASQHFKTLSTFYHSSPTIKKHQKFNVRLALLTRSQAAISLEGKKKELKKDRLKDLIKQNQIPIIIGTHALLQEDASFPNLALIIVDEQHRFGVRQREMLTLRNKKITPHFLSLTATPIPRTLALTLYGNLEISLLTKKLDKRKKVETKLIPPHLRNATYQFLEKILEKKQQIFVVTPLIKESEKLTAKAAEKVYQEMQTRFPHYKVALLHGKMKGEEKNKIMHLFQKNKINILVSTSVVEVGIDVPNATIMVIESAERFGLAQLHQLRGRVGRGEQQSYCFIFTEGRETKALRRLQSFVKIQDGFELSELDLRLRGPGAFSGLEQSGFLHLKMANLSDVKLIKESARAAQELLDQDPRLIRHRLLRKKIPQLITKHEE